MVHKSPSPQSGGFFYPPKFKIAIFASLKDCFFHMNFRLLLILLFLALSFVPLLPAQSISGLITDAYSGFPVPGCGVLIKNEDAQYQTSSDQNGNYQLLEILPGRYTLIITREGYNNLVATEVFAVPGRPLTYQHELTPLAYEMETVYVRASDTWDVRQDVWVEVIGIEQTERFAANFQDPARVVSALAGVAQLNDQTNHLSIRGLSPIYAKWYLEGMEIINPNHTNNAGTLSDLPTQAGGGVLLFSSQVLGNTILSKGPHPVEYSNALSGIVDLHYRNPSVTESKYTATLSLIGLEGNAEGPLGPGKKSSWLANYRYSTVGLLSAMGVSFGGEDIRFQDAHLQLNIATGQKSQLKLFGFWGTDVNDFEGMENPEEREEDKERFNIRFENILFGAGMKYQTLIGSKSLIKAGAVYSRSDALRNQFRLAPSQDPDFYRYTGMQNELLSSFVELQSKVGLTGRLNAGIQGKWLRDELENDFSPGEDIETAQGTNARLQLRPYANYLLQLSRRLQAQVGTAVSLWSTDNRLLFEPRLSLTYHLRNSIRLYGGYQRTSQDAGQVIFSKNQLPVMNETSRVITAHLFHIGYEEQLTIEQKLSIEAFYTSIENAGIYDGALYASQLFDAFPPAAIAYQGKERVFGIEASFEQALTQSFFWSANATLYKSQLESPESGWVSSRFDGGYIFNLNLGKEWEKFTDRHQRTWGISARLTILGGLRDREINAEESALQEATVYASALYDQKLSTYIRPDVSVYLFKNKGNRTIRWSLDIQNVASIRNTAYFYFDAVTGQVEEKTQLGIIPILSWRIGF